MSKTWIAITSIVLTMAVMIGGGWVIAHLPSTSANADGPDGSPGSTTTVGAQAPSSTGVCVLSVIGPWSRITDDTLAYDIEVGGGDVQHFDFYPKNEVQSVSYIIPPLPRGGVAARWKGFGQMWQGNPRECAGWNWVQDATDYARGNATGQPGRLQQGHSGIVVDLRGGDFKVVEKPKGWTDDQINALLAIHKAAMTAGKTSATSAQAPSGKCEAVRQKDASRPDGANSVVTLGGDGHAYVFELWNPAVEGGKEMKVLIPAGESRTFTGFGGAIWQYPTSCSAQQVKDDFDHNGKPAYTG